MDWLPTRLFFPGEFHGERSLAQSMGSQWIISNLKSTGVNWRAEGAGTTTLCWALHKFSCYCSVTILCLTLCGFLVFHYLPGFAQTHVHWVSDAIQPSHSLLLFSLTSSFPSIRIFSSELTLPLGGQSIGALASASVFSINIEGWFLLGLHGYPCLLIQSSPSPQNF